MGRVIARGNPKSPLRHTLGALHTPPAHFPHTKLRSACAIQVVPHIVLQQTPADYHAHLGSSIHMSEPSADQYRTRNYPLLIRMTEKDKAALHALAESVGCSLSDWITMEVRKQVRERNIVVHPLSVYSTSKLRPQKNPRR